MSQRIKSRSAGEHCRETDSQRPECPMRSEHSVTAEALDRAASRPVLDRSLLLDPDIIESIQLPTKKAEVSSLSARPAAQRDWRSPTVASSTTIGYWMAWSFRISSARTPAIWKSTSSASAAQQQLQGSRPGAVVPRRVSENFGAADLPCSAWIFQDRSGLCRRLFAASHLATSFPV